MRETINVMPYRNTTWGQLAETLRRFGFAIRSREADSETLEAVHEDSGLTLLLYADEAQAMIPGSVAGYRTQLEQWDVVDGPTFDAMLAYVKSLQASSE